MSNPKFLNILLIAVLTIFIVQTFFAKPAEVETIPSDTVSIEVSAREYAIPDLPALAISNTTATPVEIDTCRDIMIERDGLAISDLPEQFCQRIPVASNATGAVDLSDISRLFLSPARFSAKLSQSGTVVSAASFDIEEVGAFRGFFRTILYAPLYNLFAWLIDNLPDHSLGLAIIIVTIGIRLLLLKPQQHMLENTRRMQELQPRVKALQERHKDDQSKLGMELLDLYKKEGINPLGSFLPLLLQLPILIMLYSVILHIESPTNAYFLYAPLAGFDVESINTDFLGLGLASIGSDAAIIMAVLVGGLQALQGWLSMPPETEKKPAKKSSDENEPTMPDAAAMSRAMLFILPPIVGVSVYFFPLGVGLYWLVNTAFMIAQQLVVNRKKNRA
ncbi:MAG TPA: YidC/Oxa1 family membrane protein insertase [bacterium]|nr:YidC/Oxa1 family membrane protein insertase [bacterium]